MIYSKISEILKLSNSILCSKVKLLHIYFILQEIAVLIVF